MIVVHNDRRCWTFFKFDGNIIITERNAITNQIENPQSIGTKMRTMGSKSFCLSLICIWVFLMDCNAFQAHTNTRMVHRTTKSQPTTIVSLGPSPLHVPLGPLIYRTCTHLAASDQDFESTKDSNLPSLWLFAGIPLLSLALPLLLQAKLIVPLVVAKRVYMYTLAATVLVIASIRGTSDSPFLGTRVIDLTREILPSGDGDGDGDVSNQNDDTRFQEFQVLDNVDDSTQAVGLPLIVASSLVTSLFFVLLQSTDFSSTATTTNSVPFLQSIQSFLPQAITLSNGVVVALFARAELQKLLPNQQQIIATVGALLLSGLAFLGPAAWVWPIQNILCACLAISVARAIQIPRLAPIVLALSALVVYDVATVGLQLIDLGSATLATSTPPPQGDVVATTSAAASSSSSVMKAVALSKTEGMWQPGLFQVRLRGIVTDLLGLGDSVFPTLLSTFLLRFDQEETRNTNYFAASIVGFGIGCTHPLSKVQACLPFCFWSLPCS
jgi:hypothetical protein